jgi:hypothetical protein
VFVRIARFEGGDEGAMERTIDRIKADSGNPPPGLEGAKRVLVLIDRENGNGLGMTFFDTEDDLRRGDEALNAMSPEGDARRASVEIYEIGLEHRF